MRMLVQTVVRVVSVLVVIALPAHAARAVRAVRAATADVVVPAPDVVTRVVLRASATTASADIGSLRPGEQAELLGSVPNWYRVRLANGTEGFVSKRWTRLEQDADGPVITVDVADLGTGLGILVRGPDFTLVYDGGSNDDLARGEENRMLAYVREVAPSLTTIDHVILSHPHRDHVELLPDLFAAYEVREVWDSGRLNDICGYRAFLAAVRDEPGVAYHTATEGGGVGSHVFGAKTCYGDSLPAEDIRIPQASRIDQAPVALGEGASMTFLHADGSDHDSPNENSLVVRLDLGRTRILLMGDAEAGGRKPPTEAPAPQSIEGVLVACCAAELSAQVLVVGHHGSTTSSRTAFLDAVDATIFVVSSGPKKYGSVVLPDSSIIDVLSARGTVFRTDTDDDACRLNGAKVGPDGDGRVGGCDNIRIVSSPTGAPRVTIFRGAIPP